MSIPTAVSGATNMDQVIYYIYRNANTYSRIINSINKAQDARAKATAFCFVFIHPSTGVQTYIPGDRVLDIFYTPYAITPNCVGESTFREIIVNRNFFISVLRGYYDSLNARDKQTLYCKNLTVPPTLFPSVTSAYSTCVVTGSQLISLYDKANVAGSGGLPSPPLIGQA